MAVASFFSQLFIMLPRLRYALSPPVLNDQDLSDAQCDNAGNLKVRIVGGSLSGTGATTESRSAAYEKSHVVKAAAGSLYEISGSNKSAATIYLMVFDSATVPVNGVAKKYQVQVAAGQSFSWTPALAPTFAAGISWAVSTTPDTLTLTATNDADCVVYFS